MKLALLSLSLLAACNSAESYLDTGPAGPDGAGGGDADLRPWTGTAEVSFVDFNGNSGVVTAEVTWVATAHDEDGVDYAPEGTVTVTRDQPGCTVEIDPSSHAIDPTNDGYLRVDRAGTYRGFAGTFWDVTYTTTCAPNPPASMPSIVTNQWLNRPSPGPMTGPDELSGDVTESGFHFIWHFTR